MPRRFRTNGISDVALQAHCHNLGLEEFLKQLEDVFDRAHEDTAIFEEKVISAQYENAREEIRVLRKKIFPVERKEHD